MNNSTNITTEDKFTDACQVQLLKEYWNTLCELDEMDILAQEERNFE